MNICDQCETVAHCTKRGCIPLETATDSGHKVAHGRRTDYFGKAAEGNPGYPYTLLDADDPEADPTFWPWLQDLFYTAVYIVGSVAIGFILLITLLLTTGLGRAIF